MTTRRVMRSVLHNFLDTYTSRYSDYRGYWLHGQLLADLGQFEFNLLEPVPDSLDSNGLVAGARLLASQRFTEQLQKSGLSAQMIQEAKLQIVRIDGVVKGWQGDFMADGHMVRYTARSVMDNGSVYQDERIVFVAPHDPAKERRCHVTDSGTQ